MFHGGVAGRNGGIESAIDEALGFEDSATAAMSDTARVPAE